MLDDATLEGFLRTSYGRAVGAVTLVSGSQAVAEDAVQEALTRAWERSNGPDQVEQLEAWVLTVALNLARSRFRRLRVERMARPRLTPVEPSPPDADAIDVRRAVGALPRRQREAVVLRYFMDMDVTDVARVMGTSEGSAKSTLARGRDNLRASLGAFEPKVESHDER